MSYPIIFKLKEEAGYFDASSFNDEELCRIPEDTVCLSLENARITDRGISILPSLKRLRCIDLDSTDITDQAMKVICKMSSLEEMWIEDTKITDDGFKMLALLSNLNYISIWDTGISEEAYNYLKSKLPDLQIVG